MLEKKCNCKEPYDPDYFQGGYPYCPIHPAPTQLPAEVVQQIDKQAEAHNTRLKELAESEKDEAYAQGFAEGWGEGATAYAEKLHQAQQEVEELKRWKQEAMQILNPIREYADEKLGVPPGGCKVKAVMHYIVKSDNLLSLYKQADKTNSDLIERAVTLIEKIISVCGDTLIHHTSIANEIKTFLDGTK